MPPSLAQKFGPVTAHKSESRRIACFLGFVAGSPTATQFSPSGGLNSKLHEVCDDEGRPLVLLLGEGQTSLHWEFTPTCIAERFLSFA
jgi:hypothetical protein